MRTLIAIALVASAGFATLAQAQTQAVADTSSVRIKGIPASRQLLLSAEQFADFGGAYMLSNGKRLTVSGDNFHYFAQIEGQRPVEIVPTAHKQFLATNGDMQLDFDEFRGDHTADVVVRTGLRGENVALLESR